MSEASALHFVAPTQRAVPPADARWSVGAIEDLLALPFADLLYRAQQVHREHFDANEVQLSTLL